VEMAISKIANAPRKSKSREMAETGHVIDGACCVRIVLANIQRAFVVQQAVKNVRGPTGVGRDDLGVKRRVAIGDMRIKFDAGLRAIFGVVVGAGFAMPALFEKLSIRRWCTAIAPDSRERLCMDRFDQARQRRLIGFVPNVLFRNPEQFRMTEDLGAARYSGEARLVASASNAVISPIFSSGGAPVRR
jgi:hypothetical protein